MTQLRYLPRVLVITALLAGCERKVDRYIPVAPTPAALECARRIVVEHGYRPSPQAAEDGTPAFYRNLMGRNGDPPQEDAANDSIHDHLTIRAAGDRLLIDAVGGTIWGKERAPSPRTLTHIQEMAARIGAECAKSRP